MSIRQHVQQVALLVVLLIAASTVTSTGSEEKELYFLLVISSAATLNTSVVVPAVDQALEDINAEDSGILPGHKLQYTGGSPVDSKVRTSHSQHILYLS